MRWGWPGAIACGQHALYYIYTVHGTSRCRSHTLTCTLSTVHRCLRYLPFIALRPTLDARRSSGADGGEPPAAGGHARRGRGPQAIPMTATTRTPRASELLTLVTTGTAVAERLSHTTATVARPPTRPRLRSSGRQRHVPPCAWWRRYSTSQPARRGARACGV
jgi:hypothetical protein